MTIITKNMLKQKFSLGVGSEIHLNADDELSSDAIRLLSQRNIRVLYLDHLGNVISQDEAKSKQHHPLWISPEKRKISKHVSSTTKKEHMTLLNDVDLVAKNHPRIKFRGEIDDLIAFIILVQEQFIEQPHLKTVSLWLQDLRSQLGKIMQAEVFDQKLPEMTMGDFSFADIRKISHNPLKYLGHNHIVPAVTYGPQASWLNQLRTKVRKTEIFAIDIFENDPIHDGIIMALNRMSSAVYILMIITIMLNKKIEPKINIHQI